MRRWFVLLFVWAGGVVALYVGWLLVIFASGGAITECNRADCGSLGEWSYGHGGEVFAVIVALAWVPGFFAMRLYDRGKG
jgi:hypothetical protein